MKEDDAFNSLDFFLHGRNSVVAEFSFSVSGALGFSPLETVENPILPLGF